MFTRVFFIALLSSVQIAYAHGPDHKVSNKFNPALELNALMLWQNSAREDENDGLLIQSAEMILSADVNDQFHAEAFFHYHPEEHHGNHSHSASFELEELFVETMDLSWGTFKIGKFLSEFGSHSHLHTHALPFVKHGRLYERTFGEEGLADVGVVMSYGLPLVWKSELVLQVLQPSNSELFDDHERHSLAYLSRFKNQIKISNSLLIEAGVSSIFWNGHEDDRTTVLGADIAFKLLPSSNAKQAVFSWTLDYINKEQNLGFGDRYSGVSTYISWFFAKKLELLTRYEHLGLVRRYGDAMERGYTGAIAYHLNSATRILWQYDQLDDESAEDEKRLMMQLNVSFGAH